MSSYCQDGGCRTQFWELCALTVMTLSVCLGSMSGFIVLISTGGRGGGVGGGGRSPVQIEENSLISVVPDNERSVQAGFFYIIHTLWPFQRRILELCQI